MLHTKRLAYREDKKAEKPKHLKSLFFGALCGATLMTLASCAHADLISKNEAATATKRYMPAWDFGRQEHETTQGKCGADLTALAVEGKKVVESVCTENYEYVRTKDDFRIFPLKKQETMDIDGMKVTYNHMILEIKSLFKTGIVDWEATDETLYLMLRDNTLAVVPREKKSDEVSYYDLYFDAAKMGKDRMTTFKGFLVLAAPQGSIMFLKDGEWYRRPSHMSGFDATMYKIGNRLFFGKKNGADVEIVIDGDGPWIAFPPR